jgi:hypothetical protein
VTVDDAVEEKDECQSKTRIMASQVQVKEQINHVQVIIARSFKASAKSKASVNINSRATTIAATVCKS